MELEKDKPAEPGPFPESVLTGIVPGFVTDDIRNSAQVLPKLFGFAADYQAREHLYSNEPAPYADSMLEHLTLRTPGNFLANQVLVDLGAGRASFGYQIASRFGASAYIANELDFSSYRKLMEALRVAVTDSGNVIPAFAFAEDMMATLNRIPSDSVSFLISGLDEFILQDTRFAANLAEKVIEKVSSGGSIILASAHSVINQRMAAAPELTEVSSLKPESSFLHFNVYRCTKSASDVLSRTDLPARE